jgi:hypothetical protein
MTETTFKPLALASLPALKQSLEGGTFAGVITLPDGTHYAVTVLLDARPPKRLKHAAAVEWAKSVGGQLITRAIGSLIVSTLGDLLPQEWVWTSETYGSSSAWNCYLGNGGVGNYVRSAEGGAVAVRLIPLAT